MLTRFKAFEEMTDRDYGDLDLKVGLEIHQQLATDRKLFCRCPVGRYSDDYDAEILRHMRPTLSELGEYDGTALMEKKTRKNIIYRIRRDTVCTYEMDDTPPFHMDERALDIAIEVALLLRLNIVGELHIARKQYLDGSIPTGFQRTTIIGVDGWIPYRGRKIRIQQLGLEEDACREVADVGHDRVYLTDRLGMPIFEPVTRPDMRTPEEAAEVAEIIRKLVRSTGKVRTGYGAGRQDVNVSVAGGTRIEIKGVPRISRIPRLVYNEVRRQWSLLRIRDELHRRGVREETFRHDVRDVTGLLTGSAYEPIRRAIDRGERAKCVVLRGFAGLLREQTQENTTFAKEFSDRVRVIACLTTLPNIANSDSGAETLTGLEWQRVRKKTRATPDDELVLVWGNEKDSVTACEEIGIRALEATRGIPSDTRQALKDGTTGFERVLPGAERMYPDTDLPPKAIDPARVERIRAQLPEFVWDREAWYRELGLAEDIIVRLPHSRYARVFAHIVRDLDVDARLAGEVLVRRVKALARDGLDCSRIPEETIFGSFAAYADGRVLREGLLLILRELASRGEPAPGTVRVEELIRELGLSPMSDDELARAVESVISAEAGSATRRFATAEKKRRYLTGRVMKEHPARADGGRVWRLLGARVGGGVRV